MKKMSIPSRILVALASLSLILTFFLPVWFIYLRAPQYPEGLTMQIWLYQLTGQIEIINGLNHYIGMQKIKQEMFPELDYMVYVVGFFIILGLVVALTGFRKLLSAYVALMVIGATALMVDFYRWGYSYGHDLNPHAAIQVPGLSYQPPLLGHKQLLNFDAYSYPDSGGWVVVAAGLFFFSVLIFEWMKLRKKKKSNSFYSAKYIPAIAASLAFMLNSCSSGPEPFQYGKDICQECKMTIMDPKFGGEIITNKGKTFKFDDPHCLHSFLKTGGIQEKDIHQIVFINYQDSKEFLDVRDLHFVVSPELNSPMNSNAAAFPTRQLAEQKAAEVKGNVTTWDQLKQVLK